MIRENMKKVESEELEAMEYKYKKNKLKHDFFCEECGASGVLEGRVFECPQCATNENIALTDFIVCACGEHVYFPGFTSVCKCGKLYILDEHSGNLISFKGKKYEIYKLV